MLRCESSAILNGGVRFVPSTTRCSGKKSPFCTESAPEPIINIIAEYIWFLVVMDKSCFYKNKDVVVTESGVRTHAVNDYQKSHQFFR